MKSILEHLATLEYMLVLVVVIFFLAFVSHASLRYSPNPVPPRVEMQDSRPISPHKFERVHSTRPSTAKL